MSKNNKENTFELSLDRLENIVNKMESGDASLEKSLEWFEEGMQLIKSCQKQLIEAEQKVEELIEKSSTELDSIETQ